MPKIVSCQIDDNLVNRLDTVCKTIKLSRNALLAGMVREKVQEIEKELQLEVSNEVS